ncbi:MULTISPECIES: NACHT domain-containing protein [unclassified Microcoleus]
MFQLEEDTFKLNNILQTFPCLILFDGLNEVNNTQRSTVISNIAQFLITYPNHKYVITSRPQDELWRMLSPEDIEINLVIQPIDYEDTVRYLSLHLGEKIGRMAYSEVSAKFKKLLRLPLILGMFKEDVYQTKLNLESLGGVIDEVSLGASKLTPQNRGELYKRFMEKFFIRETSKIEGQTTTIKRLKNYVLSNLALAMHKQKTLYLSYQEVIFIFNESLKNIQANVSVFYY